MKRFAPPERNGARRMASPSKPAMTNSGGSATTPSAEQTWALSASDGRRQLSVIVPVHDGAAVLRQALEALVRSTLPRESWELVVVDDASTDDSALVAAEYADVLIRLSGKPRGPAYARNRGCEASEGELLVFIDADVCVHADALQRFASLFAAEHELSAVFGSYDAAPGSAGIVSQFRNLLHHHVHQRSGGAAETFWAGCGALRRSALLDVEMFNEWHYNRPEIEDIEIGRRLRKKNHQILLRPEIQATHLKNWSLREMLLTDFSSRGVPWTRVLLQERSFANFEALNLSRRERISAVAATIGFICLAFALERRSVALAAAALAVVAIVVLVHADLFGLLRRRGGAPLMISGVPLLLMYYVTAVCAAVVGLFAHILLGEPQAPPDAEAEAALQLDIWPPSPRSPSDHPWA